MIAAARFWIPAAVTASLIFVVSHQPHIPSAADVVPDWLAHGLEYGFFTLTLVYATTRGFEPQRRRAAPALAAVLIAAAYGVTDEVHQSFVGRDATVADWLADVTGALLMATLILLAWRRMAASDGRL